MALLELHELTSGYGYGPDILNGVTLNVEAGRSYCIIGPNGAGKSTLLKTVAGLLRPRQGQVLFDGSPIGGTRPDLVLATGVCYVPQDRSLFPEMSVKENLVMGAFLERDKAVIAERMDRVFQMFPVLQNRLHQRAGTMSGGEQQMLALGMALMTQPKWLLLDEPCTGLAPIIIDAVMKRLLEVNKRYGTGLLIVEQNVPITLKAVDRAVILKAGRMVFDGSARELEEKKDLWQWF